MGRILPLLEVYYGSRCRFHFFKEIFSCHGLPKEIVFNQGTQFVSIFFLLLTKALDIKQCLSSAFHPQILVKLRGLIKFLSIILDATPQIPRTIGLTYCLWLCLPKTATTNSSTKMSLFVANFGYHPSIVNLRTPTPHKDATSLLSKLKVT